MSCVSVPILCPYAFVAPATIPVIIRETHAAYLIHKRIEEADRVLKAYRLELQCRSTFQWDGDMLSFHQIEDLCQKAAIDLATLKAVAKETRPPRLSPGEIAMINSQNLLDMSKDDLYLIPDIVSKEQWSLLSMIIKKIV